MRRKTTVVVEAPLAIGAFPCLVPAVGLEPAAIRVAVLSDGTRPLLLEIARLPLFVPLMLLNGVGTPLIVTLMLHRLTLHLLATGLLMLSLPLRLLMLYLLTLRLLMPSLLVLGLALRLLMLRLSLHLRAGVAAISRRHPLRLLPARLRHLHAMTATVALAVGGSGMAAPAILSRLGLCVSAAAMCGRPAAAMTVATTMRAGGRRCRNGQRRNAGNEHDLRHDKSPSSVPNGSTQTSFRRQSVEKTALPP